MKKITSQKIVSLISLLAIPFLGIPGNITKTDCNLNAWVSSQSNPSCLDPNAGNNGSATVSVNNGTGPYTYLWSDALAQTTATATGLSAGTYTVTVEDALGCTASSAVTLQDISVSINYVQNVACMGQNTGNVNALAMGGVVPYTWSWSDGGTNSNDNSMSAGSYTVTLTDNNGCTATASAVITQPATLLTASISSSTNLICNGGTNGSATVSVTGGNAPYMYNWNPSWQTTASATGLVANTYTVNVNDANGCAVTATVAITQPANLSVSITNNNTCNGGATGSASASVTGGTSPYTYLWNDALAQTTATATGLSAGNYTLTVTDNNGCTSNLVTNISSYSVFNAFTSVNNNVSCNGGNNGSANSWETGGSSPFSFYWNNAQTNSTATNLSAGTYTVTISDLNGCTATSSVIINQPTTLSLTMSQNNISCNGWGNGNASVSVSGGTPSYNYSWSNGTVGVNSIGGLSVGSYTVTVNDNNGCTATASVAITQPTTLTATISSVTDNLCNGSGSGSATVTASGGTSPYTYSWNPHTQFGSTATGLSAGAYTVTVTDNNGCTATSMVVIETQDNPSASISTARDLACAGASNGMAIALPSNGFAAYTYSWTPGSQTHAIASGLSAGTYTVVITDMLGCTATASVNITQPQPITVNVYNALSVAYAVASGGTPPYTYSWSPVISTTALATGLSAGQYTVFVTDSNSCIDSAILNLTSNLKLPSIKSLPYPRWSKRGMYVSDAKFCLDSANYLTQLVTYCRNNHITYCLFDNTYWQAGPWSVFCQDSAYVDPVYGPKFENVIDSLKTRGGVLEVGVIVDSDYYTGLDSNSISVRDFDVDNFSRSVHKYNAPLPWNKRVDVLSLDIEFWNYHTNDSVQSYKLFHGEFMQMLKSMYAAARDCPNNYLRVEVYLEGPMNTNNNAHSVTDPTEVMMADSISLYADRILNSCYTAYPSVLYDRSGFIMEYALFGRNPNKNMEIWPVFEAADSNLHTLCKICFEGDTGTDYLGDSMCAKHQTPDYMEQRYFHDLSYSEKIKQFTSTNGNFAMGADTNFKVLGSMWFQYRCLSNYQFDTNTGSSHNIHFYVTLGRDSEWHGTNIVLHANVHIQAGGQIIGYGWFNFNTTAKDSIITATLGNTYTVTFPARYAVEVVGVIGSDTVTAIDYVNIYDSCYNGYVSIPMVKETGGSVTIYPNPSPGIFTIAFGHSELVSESQNMVEVYNVLGEKVYAGMLNQVQHDEQINLSSQPNGVYFCRVFKENGVLIGKWKIIIEK